MATLQWAKHRVRLNKSIMREEELKIRFKSRGRGYTRRVWLCA